jgi:oxygen-independent coproporphyrinogen-3 oxidase
VDEWREDLETAISLGTGHVSAYCLTYEEGTPMTGMKKAGLVTAADEDTELAMFRLAREMLPAAGLAQYEVSNFARPGSESRHNLAYWTWRDYLGLGAGAHGFSKNAAASYEAAGATPTSFGRRYSNIRLPEIYMSAGDGRWHATEESLSREMAMAEYLLVGLRLSAGIDAAEFEKTFGCALADAAPKLESFVGRGVLARRGDVVSLTTRGLEIADTVISQLAAG